MKIVQAYSVFCAGGLLGRFLKKEDAETLRDKANADHPSRLPYYAAKVEPCFLLESEHEGVTRRFALQSVQVT